MRTEAGVRLAGPSPGVANQAQPGGAFSRLHLRASGVLMPRYFTRLPRSLARCCCGDSLV